MLKHRIVTVIFIVLLLLLALLSFFTAVSFWYFVLLVFVRFVVTLAGSSLIHLNYHVKAHCSNPSEKEKKIALTFDDGPNPNTLKILDVLRKYQAKAAFFCIGKNIEAHPEIFRKIISEGHIVGNHSYHHSHFFDFYRKGRVLSEIKDTDAIIERLSGKKPVFFRPPYGVTNPSIRRALAVTGHKVIGWNIRSMDGVTGNENIVLNRIVKRISPGSVVLLHDTKEATISVLEQLLLFLQQNNYTVVPPEQLLNLEPYEN